jgi:ribosomal protein S21
MAIIAEVKKVGSESPAAMIRRFTKRVQGTQALTKVREERYFSRKLSKLKLKRRALDGIRKQIEFTRLLKLGKAPERANVRHR